MGMPAQRIRILAGTPIEVNNQRLLPSVLVNTLDMDQPNTGKLRVIKLRPISIVATSPQNTEWMEIPNATTDTLSTMAGAGAAIALVSRFVIVVTRLLKR